MSRIGKNPIEIPAGVTVSIDGQTITVKGPKGELSHTVTAPITVAQEDATIVVTRPNDERRNRALHGLNRSLVANLVEGVTKGYTNKMEIFGVGYRVQAKGKDLEFALGYSHPVPIELPRASPLPSSRPPSSRCRVSTSSKSARSRRTSAACVARTRTRARAFATKASRSVARSERRVSKP